MISVVIVNYNGGNKVLKSIQSVLNQSYNNFEIIVVDNKSNDNSLQNIEKIKSTKVKLVTLDKNYGFTVGCNRGISLSKGKYILVLNNDAYLSEKNFLARATRVLDKSSSKICGLLPKVLFNWEKNIVNSKYSSWHQKTMWVDSSIGSVDSNIFGIQEEPSRVFGGMFIAPIFKKKTIKKVGLFDESLFTYGEDFDISYRLATQGLNFIYVPKLEAYHDFRSSSKDEDNPLWAYFYFLRNYLIVILKNYELKSLIRQFPTYTVYLRRTFSKSLRKRNIKLAFLAIRVCISLIILFPIIIRKRLKIQKQRKVSDNKIWTNWFTVGFNPFFYNSKIVLNIMNIKHFG